MSEIREDNRVTLTVEGRNEIVERYYEYALDCLKRHELDVEEYHGEICVFLCNLADKFGYVKCMDSLYHSRIHLYIHRIIQTIDKHQSVSEILLVNEVPETEYSMDWCSMYMALALDKVLHTLTDREREILVRVYMRGMTLVEVGCDMHISAGRVQQIHAKALRKLRHPSRLRNLKGLLN